MTRDIAVMQRTKCPLDWIIGMSMEIYTIFIVDNVIIIGYGIGSECGERIKGNVLDFCVWFKVMVMALTAHTPHSAML